MIIGIGVLPTRAAATAPVRSLGKVKVAPRATILSTFKPAAAVTAKALLPTPPPPHPPIALGKARVTPPPSSVPSSGPPVGAASDAGLASSAFAPIAPSSGGGAGGGYASSLDGGGGADVEPRSESPVHEVASPGVPTWAWAVGGALVLGIGAFALSRR